MNKRNNLSNMSMEELIRLVLDLQNELSIAQEKIHKLQVSNDKLQVSNDKLQVSNDKFRVDNEKLKAELARAKKSRPSQR